MPVAPTNRGCQWRLTDRSASSLVGYMPIETCFPALSVISACQPPVVLRTVPNDRRRLMDAPHLARDAATVCCLGAGCTSGGGHERVDVVAGETHVAAQAVDRDPSLGDEAPREPNRDVHGIGGLLDGDQLLCWCPDLLAPRSGQVSPEFLTLTRQSDRAETPPSPGVGSPGRESRDSRRRFRATASRVAGLPGTRRRRAQQIAPVLARMAVSVFDLLGCRYVSHSVASRSARIA